MKNMLDILNSKLKTNISWDCLFAPNAVAVIGASNIPATWGYNILWRLLSSGKRNVYAVNPNCTEVLGVATYDSILDIPDALDLAVIAVPAARVPGVLRECVQKGVRAAVIISGGFAETGEEGSRLEAEVLQIAREGGINFVGPNTMGHANTAAQLSTLSWVGAITPGPVALVSQSGNCGSRVLRHGMALGIGFSKFVCAGNEADLTLEDYLEYLSRDENTTIITTYIEGLRQARRFYQLAKGTTRKKPIVALKAGGTEGSARAARSHTGALTGSAAVYAAAFKQAGVISVDDDDELCDVVLALLHQPLPRNSRVGIITVGGGLGVVATEACEREGLVMAPLSPSTMETLNAILPPRWSHGNPVDLAGISAIVDNQAILSSLQTLLEDENIDAVMLQVPLAFGATYLTHTLHFDAAAITAFMETQQRNVDLVKQWAAECRKPVLVVTPVNDPETMSYLLQERLPTYPNPHRAARVLRHLAWYRHYLDARR